MHAVEGVEDGRRSGGEKGGRDDGWTVYRAAHPDVDTQNSPRYLYRRSEERENDTEELTSFWIAYLR
jgi:hypothetical protein